MSETVRINTTKVGVCSTCGIEYGDADPVLKLTLERGGALIDAVICRWCLAEHSPDLLAEIEAAE